MELLRMGPHCYVEYKPEVPVEQMSAEEILSAPDGVYEEEKTAIREARKQSAADAEKVIEDRKKEKTVQDKKEKQEIKDREQPPAVSTSPAVALAEARIKELINSFKPLTTPKFKEWIDINRDLIPTMPEDVKAELAKKILAKFPDEDPDIPGLVLEKYASKDPTDKGHSNNE